MHAGEKLLALGGAHENPHDGFIPDEPGPCPARCCLRFRTARSRAHDLGPITAGAGGTGRSAVALTGDLAAYHAKLQGPWYANADARDPPFWRR